MFNHPTLLACGYLFLAATSTKYIYQKRVCAENGDTLYFIEILDSFGALAAEAARLGLPEDWASENRYSVTVILYTNEAWNPRCKNELAFSANAMTSIKHIEDKIAATFTALNCIPNPHN